MRSARMRRVDEAVREVLADAIPRCVKDPRVGFVTVTDVNTSPDLRHAQVFVSVLGDEDARSGVPRGADSAHGVLQREVGRLAAHEAHADADLPHRRDRAAARRAWRH